MWREIRTRAVLSLGNPAAAQEGYLKVMYMPEINEGQLLKFLISMFEVR